MITLPPWVRCIASGGANLGGDTNGLNADPREQNTRNSAGVIEQPQRQGIWRAVLCVYSRSVITSVTGFAA